MQNVLQVTAHGRGIEKYCVEVDTPLEFMVDTRSAGAAPLGVAVTDTDRQPVNVTVKDNNDGTYLCRYVPSKRVKHVVVVTYGGVVIPNFPVRVSKGQIPRVSTFPVTSL